MESELKVIIAQGKTKREIRGPFGICASREDFETIAERIAEFLNDPGNGCGISYGWLQIHKPPTIEMGIPGYKPRPWEE